MATVTIKDLAKEIKDVVRTDRDFPVVISGTPGEGKSCLAAQLCKIGDKNFAFSRNFIYGRKRWEKQIETLDRYSFLVSDESSNVGHKRDWMTEAQKRIIRVLDMCRDRNLALIFVLPNIWSLDSEILRRMKAWVFVGTRGIAHVFKPNYDNPFCKDPWYRKQNEKKLERWNPATEPFKAKGYCDTIDFEDLSEEEWKVYLQVKEEGRKEGLKEKRKHWQHNGQLMVKYFHKGHYNCLKTLKKFKLLKRGAIKTLGDYEGIGKDAYRMRINNAQNITQLIREESENEESETTTV